MPSVPDISDLQMTPELPLTDRWIDERPATPRAQPLSRGTIVGGRYQVTRLLGQGGMAQVYQAHDLDLDRDVAVKLALPGAEPSLRREARVLAGVRSPGLVTVHSWGEHAGSAFIVLEYIEGRSLASQLIERDREGLGPFSIDEALDLTVAICEALEPLHQSAFAHFDLKPSNVMCAGDRVVLIDLGIARDERSPSKRAISGSPHFMAPESIEGEVAPHQAHLADIYAVGVILFALVAGRPPFDDPDGARVMRLQVEAEPPLLSSLRPDLPPRLEALVGSMLAKAPEDRPQDVARLRAALLGIPRCRPRH